jgi:hypothetical protein
MTIDCMNLRGHTLKEKELILKWDNWIEPRMQQYNDITLDKWDIVGLCPKVGLAQQPQAQFGPRDNGVQPI